MNLYVPEIGDKIVLEQPWKFKLYAEYRNESVASFYGHYLNYKMFIDSSVLPPFRDRDYKVNYPEYKSGLTISLFGRMKYTNNELAYREAEKNCPEYVKYQEDYKIYASKLQEIGKQFLEVEFPVGTELIVDRIYIRKGISEYSSLSFLTTNLGTAPVQTCNKKKITKKSLRFWAKLSDCNTIIFKKNENNNYNNNG